MLPEVLGPLSGLLVILIVLVARSVRQVQQYEKGVVWRFGQILPEIRNPGLTWIRPIGYRLQKVNMQIVTMEIPAKEGITRDNVGVEVDAVVYFRVIDPFSAVANVQDYMSAVSQQAQTSLLSVIGQSEMDQLLAGRDTLNTRLRESIGDAIEGLKMGVRVERAEIKDVSLSETTKQSMARQAEAERERLEPRISADGEQQASERLDAAAVSTTASEPVAQPPFPPNTMTGDDRGIWSIA
jgi:regulator of protease activity HflC (stomatin/prohibitin superfamily)